ncbi:AMP-binding protein [Streptomyces sp. NPDC051173]|uniref:AMP-binding protein n=1 Tax=Streptomyces sp. NPDC051173 TaxID=3155164 RepID=UPI003450AD91
MTTVWDLVSEQARRTPDAQAAVGERVHTYRDLVRSVDVLAAALRETVPAGSWLAVETASPVSGAVALLTGARVGCALVPLNLDSPAAHRAFVLEDARPVAVLRSAEEGVFTVEHLDREGAEDPGDRVPGDAAYVMYTSGSSGRPKGVVVPPSALASCLRALAEVPGLRAGETMLAMTALSFDISLAEMLVPLIVGARFVVVPGEVRADPELFDAFIRLHRPDVVQATPSFWRRLLAGGGSVAAHRFRVWCGGEPLTAPLAESLLGRSTELWNLYGPTEATIWATAARIESPDALSLGQPLRGMSWYLDQGEIVLYGDHLATGYHGRADLTAACFSVRDTPEGPRHTYRTGDRARPAPDGSFQYLGRADGQIKLRGHRIELGEVESVLEEHAEITEAVALVRDPDRAERALIAAYVVSASDLTAPEVSAWTRTRLPAAYCPGQVHVVRSLPRNASGKVDRNALARPDFLESRTT